MRADSLLNRLHKAMRNERPLLTKIRGVQCLKCYLSRVDYDKLEYEDRKSNPERRQSSFI